MNFSLDIKPIEKAKPIVWNYEQLRSELSTALADYQNRVYTEDMIAEAKGDAAKLNKLKKAISDERIARKKEWLEPFETFEAQAKEICQMIDTASSGIKTQLDTFEQKRIEEKTEHIESMFAEILSNYDLPFITFRQIFNEKWLNKSVTDKAIATEITTRLDQVKRDLEVIAKMPEYSYEAKECYKTSLDLNKALSEGERMSAIAKQKAEQARQEALAKAQAQIEAEQKKAEAQGEIIIGTPEAAPEPLYDLTFACRITRTQALELRQFCSEHGIKLIKV